MSTDTKVHVVLVPGFWIGGWAWDDVVGPLRDAGLEPHAVTLPGLEEAPGDVGGLTRADHADAVASLVGGLDGDVVLVGHSGGGPVVQEVADRQPARIRRLVFVDTGPLVDGATLSPPLPDGVDGIPLPTWDELAEQGSSIDGISEEGLARFRERARPQPAGVATGEVRVSNPDRLRIPATAICTSIPSAVLREMASHDAPLHTELLDYDVAFVDLPTGHWPMFSRPVELAAAIAEAARA
ncbi:esterase [Beutenbergia cavernae DSM 12333]|uniref:Esterase n=1 Tax=Beutenbergia cavernae (strain ATCC BAA-8 / DSM 12333 / CCUG 43141 / JCM 11478 / NBRC 16432 / NCIMB 13614 / HKI 0122) TaxID=471853 RepID=C5C4M3_BEUC1|nr:alpha/beta hydrolase [Beutenbergia cavernae]ACQ82147.1 esterase [Beutenbergia cavernae DSM 12333]